MLTEEYVRRKKTRIRFSHFILFMSHRIILLPPLWLQDKKWIWRQRLQDNVWQPNTSGCFPLSSLKSAIFEFPFSFASWYHRTTKRNDTIFDKTLPDGKAIDSQVDNTSWVTEIGLEIHPRDPFDWRVMPDKKRTSSPISVNKMYKKEERQDIKSKTCIKTSLLSFFRILTQETTDDWCFWYNCIACCFLVFLPSQEEYFLLHFFSSSSSLSLDAPSLFQSLFSSLFPSLCSLNRCCYSLSTSASYSFSFVWL